MESVPGAVATGYSALTSRHKRLVKYPSGKVFSPKGSNFFPAGKVFSPKGSNFFPAGKVFSPEGSNFFPAGFTHLEDGFASKVTRNLECAGNPDLSGATPLWIEPIIQSAAMMAGPISKSGRSNRDSNILTLHYVHQIPRILEKLQFQLVLFVHLELTSRVEYAGVVLLVFANDNFHSRQVVIR
jgi:hypothetical protein